MTPYDSQPDIPGQHGKRTIIHCTCVSINVRGKRISSFTYVLLITAALENRYIATSTPTILCGNLV